MKNTIYQNILTAAEALIQTKGFNAFSYKDISSIVGVKTSSIHYHFPTKADLGKEVVKKYIEGLSIEVQQMLTLTNVSCAKKLEMFIDFIIAQTYMSEKRMCLGGMLASDVLTLPEIVQHEVRIFFDKIESWIEQLLKMGEKQQEFTLRNNAKEEVQLIISIVEGSLLLARLFHDEKRLMLARKHILERLIKT